MSRLFLRGRRWSCWRLLERKKARCWPSSDGHGVLTLAMWMRRRQSGSVAEHGQKSSSSQGPRFACNDAIVSLEQYKKRIGEAGERWKRGVYGRRSQPKGPISECADLTLPGVDLGLEKKSCSSTKRPKSGTIVFPLPLIGAQQATPAFARPVPLKPPPQRHASTFPYCMLWVMMLGPKGQCGIFHTWLRERRLTGGTARHHIYRHEPSAD